MAKESSVVFGGKGLLLAGADATRSGDLLFLSCRFGVNLSDGSIPRSARDLPDGARRMYESSRYIDAIEWPMTAQTWWIYEAFRRLLEPYGANLDNLVRTNTYFRSLEDFPAMERARAALMPKDPPPSTVLEIPFGHFPAGVDLAIEGVALLPSGGERAVIRSRLGSGAHYSWGVHSKEHVWVAGQTASHPLLGEYVHRISQLGLEGMHLATGNIHLDQREGPVSAQTWITYWRTRKILEDGGVGLDHVINEKIFLRSLKHLPAVERVRREFYASADSPPPCVYLAASNIGRTNPIAGAAPATLLELDVVASRVGKCPIPGDPDGLGRLGAAGMVGGSLVSLGGWVARDPKSGQAITRPDQLGARKSALGGDAGPAAVQALWAYDRLGEVLKGQKRTLQDLAEVEIFVSPEAKVEGLNAVHKEVFPGGLPAFSLVPMEGVDPDPDISVKIGGYA